MAVTGETIRASINQATELSEGNLRQQLAALYHIFDYFGWSDLIVTHLSVRVPGEEALLINPFGVAFKEICAENLLKVDFDGNIIDSPHGHPLNNNGCTVHRAIYRGRSDIQTILHTHSLYGTAVSSLKEGLLLLDQIAMMFHNRIGYHNFDTLFIHDNDQKKLLEDLGNNNCMILRNHGLLTIGSDIAEAFWYHYYLENSCKLQVTTMSTGGTIQLADEEVIKETAARYDHWREHNQGDGVPGDKWLLFDAAKRMAAAALSR